MCADICSEIKFIADCMLGRLARWLRISGFDTCYIRRIKDPELILKAQQENRVILTRDHLLFNICGQKNLPALLIAHDLVEDQMKQVIQGLNIKSPGSVLRRCLDCNQILQKIDKHEVEDKVPIYIYDTMDEFFRCPLCRKVFWPGTHWAEMRKKLQTIFRGKV